MWAYYLGLPRQLSIQVWRWLILVPTVLTRGFEETMLCRIPKFTRAFPVLAATRPLLSFTTLAWCHKGRGGIFCKVARITITWAKIDQGAWGMPKQLPKTKTLVESTTIYKREHCERPWLPCTSAWAQILPALLSSAIHGAEHHPQPEPAPAIHLLSPQSQDQRRLNWGLSGACLGLVLGQGLYDWL